MNTRSSRNTGGLDLTEQALPWQDMVASVFRHRRSVLGILAAGVVLATLRAWSLPPTYEANAVLLVKDHRARVRVTPDKNATAMVDRTGLEQINSVTALILNPTLVREVLEQRRADGKHAARQDGALSVFDLPSLLYRKLHDVPDPSNLEKRAEAIAAAIEVEPVPRSNLINVRYASENPIWAANLVNELVGKLIEKYTTLYENEGAQEFFHSQRGVLAAKLEEAQGKLAEFRARVGAELLTLNSEQLRLRIAELEAGLSDTRTQLAELDARANASRDAILSDAQDSDPDSGIVGNPAVAALKSRIISLEIGRSEMLSRYTPTSAAVRDIDRQIAEASRLLAKERESSIDMHRKDARARMQTVTARADAIASQLHEYRKKLTVLENVTPEWERLQHEVETQKEAYLTYLRKEEEARFSNALDESQIINITVAEKAKVPHQPLSPNMLKIILLGAAMSLMAGVGLSLLRDWLDPSVKTSKQAERLAGVPVLGEIQS